MLSGKRPHVQLSARPVATPSRFDPTMSWVEQGYLYRYDSSRQICKRMPISQHAGGGSAYFRVEQLDTGNSSFKNASKLPENERERKQLADRIHRSLLHTGRMLAFRATFGSVALLALFVMTYPYLPEIQYRLYQSTPSASADTHVLSSEPVVHERRVMIPKIGVNTKILEGGDLGVLDHEEGVWHQKGELGKDNYVLAGHRFRYLPPNTSTFYNLDKLTNGDVIAIDVDGKRTTYEVKQVRVVDASEVSVIAPTEQPRLTLYTCDDMRETRRIVVVAEPL